jgi:integrase
VKITNRSLAALRTEIPGGRRFYDDELRGFVVRVEPEESGGGKHFEIRYGPRGGQHRLTIGRWGELTLDEARTKARNLLARVALGEDPSLERKRKREMPLFKTWKATYCERIRDRLKSARGIERFLDLAAERWGNRPLDSIVPADVEALFQKIGEASKTSANRWLACLRPCFAQAARDGWILSNPARDVAKFQERPPRSRVLTDDELRFLLDAIALEPDVHARLALFFLLETGARLSEVLRAEWKDVDLDAGTWLIPSPKAGKPQGVPLSRSIVAKLKRLPKLGPYVVAGRQDKEPRYDLKGPWERVVARAVVAAKKRGHSAGFLADVHVHDLRRTFGLAVAKSAGIHVASKLLRHGDVRITEKVYAPLSVEDLRPALEKRSELLPFRKKRGRRS